MQRQNNRGDQRQDWGVGWQKKKGGWGAGESASDGCLCVCGGLVAGAQHAVQSLLWLSWSGSDGILSLVCAG